MKPNARQIGKLNERISIVQPISSIDATGGKVTTWTTLVSCWADAQAMAQSDEQMRGEQIVAQNATSFAIHYRDGINEQMRIIWRNEYYDIATINQRGRREQLVIEAYRRDNQTS